MNVFPKQTHKHGEQTCDCQAEEEGERMGFGGQQMQTITFKMDAQ